MAMAHVDGRCTDFTETQPSTKLTYPRFDRMKGLYLCDVLHAKKIIQFVCDFSPQLHAQIRQLRMILHTINPRTLVSCRGQVFSKTNCALAHGYIV